MLTAKCCKFLIFHKYLVCWKSPFSINCENVKSRMLYAKWYLLNTLSTNKFVYLLFKSYTFYSFWCSMFECFLNCRVLILTYQHDASRVSLYGKALKTWSTWLVNSVCNVAIFTCFSYLFTFCTEIFEKREVRFLCSKCLYVNYQYMKARIMICEKGLSQINTIINYSHIKGNLQYILYINIYVCSIVVVLNNFN